VPTVFTTISMLAQSARSSQDSDMTVDNFQLMRSLKVHSELD